MQNVYFSHKTYRIQIATMIDIRYRTIIAYHFMNASAVLFIKLIQIQFVSVVSCTRALKSSTFHHFSNSMQNPINMSQTKSVEEDLKYAMKFVWLNLKLVGAWPTSITSSLYSKILKRIQIIVVYFLYFLVIIPGFLYMFLRTNSGKVRLKVLGPILNCCMQFVKYTILLFRAKEIRKCLDVIREDWTNSREDDRLILHSRAKLGRKLIVTVMVTLYGGGLCYRTIIPLMRGPIITPNNVTIRPMACAGYFIFINEQQTPNYEIIFTLQFFSGIVTYATTSGSYGIFTLLVLHMCSLLKMLTKKIKKLDAKSDLSEQTVQRRIVDIVEHERKIKGLLKNVEAIIEYVCFVDIAGNTCLICLMGYRIITESEKNDATFIIICITLQISFIFCSFILCYIGQLLVNENDVVGVTSIMINWYRLPIKKARCLILIIAMSNYPMQLRAGKVVAISLVTFTDIMKMSVAYLNILREVV